MNGCGGNDTVISVLKFLLVQYTPNRRGRKVFATVFQMCVAKSVRSPGGALDSSPRCKPWVKRHQGQAPLGATEREAYGHTSLIFCPRKVWLAALRFP